MNILLTGATSGIGFELAKLYQSHQLILLARKPQTVLANTPLANCLYLSCDLSDSSLNNLEQVKAFLAAQQIASLDLVIHNAATALFGPSQLYSNELSARHLVGLFHTNLYSPITLSYLLLPYLKQAQGKLVFISSTAARLAAPDYAEYAASKAAIAAFARSLRAEGNYRCQVIYPGATQTPIFAKYGINLDSSKFAKVDKVAKSIHQAIQQDDLDYIIGLNNYSLTFLAKFFAWPFDRLYSYLRSKPKKG
ncbi:MAG: SDR family NAD(P)-dependent oxidoreductase [Deinococcales bacterium]